MKRLLLILLILLICTPLGIIFAQPPEFSGEELNYRISYSIFSIGKASVTVEDLPVADQDQDKYKVTAKGVTTGLIGVFSKIDDEWGAHVYKDNFKPSFAYRRIREGRYKRDEDVDFDSAAITLNEWSFKAGKYKDPVVYETTDAVYELLSGMLYVRSLDFSTYNEDDLISFKAFFDGKFYDFKVLYKGKETVKTKIGKINAIKLVPIMPDNSLFDGENSISIWISDDKNRIPLKIEADMFIGSAGCDITEVKNIKYPINRS
ncbi:MAG: DUF3108 domain-containing protein [Cyclobacteriaceae bacterium]